MAWGVAGFSIVLHMCSLEHQCQPEERIWKQRTRERGRETSGEAGQGRREGGDTAREGQTNGLDGSTHCPRNRGKCPMCVLLGKDITRTEIQ